MAKITTIHADDLGQFLVPPVCQGQMIEYAYATGEGILVRRTTDRSARVVSYHAAPLDSVSGDVDPVNAEPQYDEAAMVEVRVTP